MVFHRRKGIHNKMFKHVKKTAVFVALVAVLVSLFGAAVSGWADGRSFGFLQTRAGDYLEGSAIPPSPFRDNSVKEISSGTTSPGIKVTLIVEAGNEYNSSPSVQNKFWVSYDVTVPSPASGDYTVTDLLVAANGVTSPNLIIYGSGTVPIASQDNYVSAIKHDTTTWRAGQAYFDGWEFRINDKFPVFANGTGWTGDSILQTNIVSGDIVHLFYDYPVDYDRDSGSFASDYVRGILLSSSASSMTIQLQGHTVYIHPATMGMYVDNYKNIQAGVTAYLYDATGTTQIDKQVSDVNGRVKFNGTFSSGDYIVKTDPVYQPGYNPADINDYTYIALTGAYSRISVQ
jgi:hypothetical protein